MIEINKIYNCDNKEILKQLPDKSIQVFLEDMPYGITACKWDKMPDLKEYWELRLSKIKDNGCFVLFGSEPFSSYLRISNIKMYKYDWIWNKNRGSNFAVVKYMPFISHEYIMIFGGKIKYIPIMEKAKQRIKKNKISYSNLTMMKNEERKGRYFNNNGLSYPNSIIEFSNANHNNSLHPTQKPVELFEYLIKTYSNENDLIFDGYSGSGTTSIASYNTNRNFICCELEKEYFDKSIERLSEAKNNLFEKT